jgi:hypothetical protein
MKSKRKKRKKKRFTQRSWRGLRPQMINAQMINAKWPVAAKRPARSYVPFLVKKTR